jgi:hypothetical protein
MDPTAPVRSSLPLVLAVLLFGNTALPMVLCASDDRRTGCAVEMPQPVASHDGHSESQAPATALSCCCDQDDALVPASAPATTTIEHVALSVAASPVAPVVLSQDVAAAAPPLLATRTRPLFTLFSAFLI